MLVRSWGALALGVICGGVTFYVLFDDVLRNGAIITTDHVLSAAVLLITIAAGHMWWTEMRTLRVFTALGLAVIFVAGSAYVVIASAGRNAEVAAEKRSAAASVNAERERITPLLERSERMLVEAQANLARECATGRGPRCQGIETTVMVYEAAIKGHVADLERLGPSREENVWLKSAAQTLSLFFEVTEETLSLLMPYVKAIIVEVATVVFLAVALGHRGVSRAQGSLGGGTPTTHGKSATASRYRRWRERQEAEMRAAGVTGISAQAWHEAKRGRRKLPTRARLKVVG